MFFTKSANLTVFLPPFTRSHVHDSALLHMYSELRTVRVAPVAPSVSPNATSEDLNV
jgi:hypothetical protein